MIARALFAVALVTTLAACGASPTLPEAHPDPQADFVASAQRAESTSIMGAGT